jgi:hypothetical protein
VAHVTTNPIVVQELSLGDKDALWSILQAPTDKFQSRMLRVGRKSTSSAAENTIQNSGAGMFLGIESKHPSNRHQVSMT